VALVTGCASTGTVPVETRSGALTNPADMTGDNVNNVWHIAKP